MCRENSSYTERLAKERFSIEIAVCIGNGNGRAHSYCSRSLPVFAMYVRPCCLTRRFSMISIDNTLWNGHARVLLHLHDVDPQVSAESLKLFGTCYTCADSVYDTQQPHAGMHWTKYLWLRRWHARSLCGRYFLCQCDELRRWGRDGETLWDRNGDEIMRTGWGG